MRSRRTHLPLGARAIVPRRGRVQLPDHCEPRPYTLLIGCPRSIQTRSAWAPALMAMKASQIGCPVARKTMARITAPKNTESRTATARTAPWFEVAGRAGARVAIARAARSRAPAPQTMPTPK
jgi:hypothetical protein